MINRRPLGVTLWGGLLTVTGGISLLVLFLEMLITISLAGLQAVLITSVHSFAGFCLYGAIPVIFYLTGIGLFLLRPWARRAMLFIIPVLTFIFFIHIGCHLVQSAWRRPWTFGDMLLYHPDIFFRLFLIFIIVVSGWIFYFRRPEIAALFRPLS